MNESFAVHQLHFCGFTEKEGKSIAFSLSLLVRFVIFDGKRKSGMHFGKPSSFIILELTYNQNRIAQV